MRAIENEEKEDMAQRNIKFLFVDVNEFYDEKDDLKIEEFN